MRCSLFYNRKYQIGFLLGLLLWGEWLSYELYSYVNWSLPGIGTIRILIIADPQLIGYQHEHWLIGRLTRWDSDRYISRGFQLAKRYSETNTLFFLGDLFDEGVEANEPEFLMSMERFATIFLRNSDRSSLFFISGDNDIGGEMEPVMEHLKHRFSEYFVNQPPITEEWNDFAIYEINYFDSKPIKKMLFKGNDSIIDILLSHLPISPGISLQENEAWQHKTSLKNKTLQSIQLNPLDTRVAGVIGSNLPIIELQTPTCSYRMGTTTIGYGVLDITKISPFNFAYTYTVFWLPSRFPQLILYLLTLAIFCPCCYVGLLLAFDYNGTDRNNSGSVWRRLLAALITCAISIYLTLHHLNWNWQAIGFRSASFERAALLSPVPVLVLYSGQILLLYFDGQLRNLRSTVYWKNSFTDICWIRDIFLAPITEEIVYRACCVSLIAGCFTKWQTIFIAPLFFGISHLHHILNDVKNRYQLRQAVFKRVFQLIYTYVFGSYATYLLLSTRHIIAPIITHSICNSLGLPMFHEIDSFSSQWQRRALYITFLVGIFGFFTIVGCLTDSMLYP